MKLMNDDYDKEDKTPNNKIGLISSSGNSGRGLKNILILIVIATFAISLIYILKSNNSMLDSNKKNIKKSDNYIKKDNDIEIKDSNNTKKANSNNDNIDIEKLDKSANIAKDDLFNDDANTANSLGSIVNEKVNLNNFEGIDKSIQSVYRVYDMSEDENGYLIKVISRGYKEGLHLAVIIDNEGERVLSVKVSSDIENTDIKDEDMLNQFLDQLYKINLPISLNETVNNQNKIEDTNNSIINEMEGAKVTSKAIVQAINLAYEFLNRFIIQNDSRNSESIF